VTSQEEIKKIGEKKPIDHDVEIEGKYFKGINEEGLGKLKVTANYDDFDLEMALFLTDNDIQQAQSLLS
jgi:hypothetical protein